MSKSASIYVKLGNIQNRLYVNKTGNNPHFKSQYFELSEILQVLRPLLVEEHLMIYQSLSNGMVCTHLVNVDDPSEAIVSHVAIPSDNNPQKVASAVTYYKRISLTALFLIEERDDDGNYASDTGETNEHRPVNNTSSKAEPEKHRAPAAANATTQGPIPKGLQDLKESLPASGLGSAKFTFGKYKGKAFKEVPLKDLRNYYDWLKDQSAKSDKVPSQTEVNLFNYLNEDHDEIPF